MIYSGRLSKFFECDKRVMTHIEHNVVRISLQLLSRKPFDLSSLDLVLHVGALCTSEISEINVLMRPFFVKKVSTKESRHDEIARAKWRVVYFSFTNELNVESCLLFRFTYRRFDRVFVEFDMSSRRQPHFVNFVHMQQYFSFKDNIDACREIYSLVNVSHGLEHPIIEDAINNDTGDDNRIDHDAVLIGLFPCAIACVEPKYFCD